MSDLQKRWESPRRRITHGSHTHPGWSCFFMGWVSGMFTSFAMIAFIQWGLERLPFRYVLVFGAIALTCYFVGGTQAEKLVRYDQ